MELIKNYINSLSEADLIESNCSLASSMTNVKGNVWIDEPNYETRQMKRYLFRNGVILQYVYYQDDTPGCFERYTFYSIEKDCGLEFDSKELEI